MSKESLSPKGRVSQSASVVDHLLDELTARTREEAQVSTRGAAPPQPFVGQVTNDRHPSLLGRVQVRWDQGGTEDTRWIPTLWGLPVRTGDRVLVQPATNHPEPIVVGVLDGFADRPDAPPQSAGTVEMRRDEAVQICSHRGVPIVEIIEGVSGPKIKLLTEDLELEVPGRLAIRASSLSLEATRETASVRAKGDVVVVGEHINLN